MYLDARRGLGVNAITLTDTNGRGAFRAGPLLNWRMARDQDDDSDLRGLGDVKSGVDLGGSASYEYGRLSLNLLGRKNVSHTELGANIELAARYKMRLPTGTMVNFGPSVSWASAEYMRAYFGVTTDQSRRSGLAAYTPSSGIKDFGLSAMAMHRLGAAWSLVGMGGYTRLVGDAADAPLVKERGSANQMRVGIGISYRLY